MRPRQQRPAKPTALRDLDVIEAAALWRAIAIPTRQLDTATWDEDPAVTTAQFLDKMAAQRLRSVLADAAGQREAHWGSLLVPNWREILVAEGVLEPA